VKILFLLAVIGALYYAWNHWGQGSEEVPQFTVVSAHWEENYLVVGLRSSVPLDPDLISVSTTGECQLIEGRFVPEENVTVLVLDCPPGETVRVSGGGVVVVKRPR